MAVVTIRGASADDLKKLMRGKIEKRMQAALILTQNEMRAGLSEQSNRLGKHDSGESAGGFPFKITGRLAGSVTYNFNQENLTGQVGSNLSYAKFLQLGTRRMAARPWLTLAWNRIADKVRQIIQGE